ncbi:unnamed protein product [Phytophthora fragariaefolia]|uniref:Unnamed protein product n=1 Tax=Phytophthora fragariaefolia TaxID=1490495 RepID=A0A9W7D145_9STRA|nr:unnamed protein product [Phytophthora fragariaefolia]
MWLTHDHDSCLTKWKLALANAVELAHPDPTQRINITDIASADNVWADLPPRWGSPLTPLCAIRLVTPPKSPVLDDLFYWPTLESVTQAQAAETPSTDLNLTRAVGGIWRTASGAGWVPARAADLQLRFLIVAPFGAAGHRGSDVTFQVIQARFWWEGIRDDVMFFAMRWLHCASVGGGPPVPIPLDMGLHAEKPNELIHFDYLYIGPSLMEFTYVLVVKDDATHFLRLYPCVIADADITYDCLMDWFATFGVVRTCVSDQGMYRKNVLMQQLQHALGGHHHFTAARTPWSNGTVEVVMREALRCFCALLSEWRIQIRTANFAAFQEVLRLLHRAAARASSTKRASSRQSKAKARVMAMAQYDIGDYVLYADVWSRTQTKLGTREIHASSLKLDWDATLDVTEDMLLHTGHNGEGHVLKRLLEARYAKEQKRYEVLVAWRGLSELENPWEPATVLKQDVPALLKKFITDRTAEGMVTKMAKALDYTKKWTSTRTAK